MHRGHFQVPCGMVVRSGRRQSLCHPALHMSQRSIFVKRTLTNLVVNIIRWRRGQESGEEGGRGEDRELGKARVRLN